MQRCDNGLLRFRSPPSVLFSPVDGGGRRSAVGSIQGGAYHGVGGEEALVDGGEKEEELKAAKEEKRISSDFSRQGNFSSEKPEKKWREKSDNRSMKANENKTLREAAFISQRLGEHFKYI